MIGVVLKVRVCTYKYDKRGNFIFTRMAIEIGFHKSEQ